MGNQPTFGGDAVDLGTFSTSYVNSIRIFDGALSGTTVTPATDLAYIWSKPVNTLDYKFIVTNINISFDTTNAVSNTWSTEIAADETLISGAAGRINIDKLDITSVNGGKWVDLTAGAGVIPILTEEGNRIIGFDSLGDMDGMTYGAENVAYIFNGAGFTMNNMTVVLFSEINFIVQGGDAITLTGTLFLGSFDKIVASPTAGNTVFNIDSGLTIAEKITIVNSPIYPAGGSMFKAGGKDHTDPMVICFNNGNEIDSNWNGDIGFEGNATVTTVGAGNVNTYLPISGTIVTGNIERCTVSNGIFTITSEEDIKIKITFSASVKNGTGGGKRNIRAVVLKGSTELRSKGVSMDGEAKDLSFSVITTASKGDTVTAKIKNEENGDNILPIDYFLTWEKLG